MPEDEAGELPVVDELNEPDNPDEWRDICDDPQTWPDDDD
jgi:hypothetical protein